MNTDRPTPPAPYVNYWKGACLTLVTGLVTCIWYGTLPYHTFMGDDLLALIFFKENIVSFWNSVAGTIASKYRPVSFGLHYIQMCLLGEHYNYHVYSNMLFEVVNCMLAAYLAWRISGKKWAMAAAAALVMVTSRFAYFSVIQVCGLLETLSMFFMLLVVLGVCLAFERSERKFLCWANAAFFLLIHTHERYVVVSGFLIMAPVLFPDTLNLRSVKARAFFVLLPLLIVAFNYLFKTQVLQVSFFVGTGGTNIGANYRQIAHYYLSSLVNMLGFNAGPSYLTALNFREAGFAGMALGIATTLSCAALLSIRLFEKYWKTLYRKRLLASDIRALILFLSLILSIILCASITIRVEQRWLYAPYAVFVLAGAWIYGDIKIHKRAAQATLAVIVAVALATSLFYRQYLDNIFFCHCMRMSDSVQTHILDHYKNSGGKTVYINHWGREDIKTWVLMDTAYFKYFGQNADLNVQYVASLNEPPPAMKLDESLFFELRHNEVADVTLSTRERFQKKPTTLEFDFLKNFESGRINDERIIATPNGKGAVKLNLLEPGGTVETMTIVSGFQYAFENISLKNESKLTLTVGIPYDVGDGARLFIEKKSAGAVPERILNMDLPPGFQGRTRWKNIDVPLGRNPVPNATFTFGVESPSGDPSADWVSIREARIVIPAEPKK